MANVTNSARDTKFIDKLLDEIIKSDGFNEDFIEFTVTSQVLSSQKARVLLRTKLAGLTQVKVINIEDGCVEIDLGPIHGRLRAHAYMLLETRINRIVDTINTEFASQEELATVR